MRTIVTNTATGYQRSQQLIKLAAHNSFIIMKQENEEIREKRRDKENDTNVDRSQI